MSRKFVCARDLQVTHPLHASSGGAARRSRFAAVIATVAMIAALNLCAQPSSPTEYEVKAAYLYNFGKFVEWPTETRVADDSFPICVLGRDPFGAIFDATVAGESINGKKVLVKRIAKAQDALACRILFISNSEERQLKEIMAGLDKASVLTVSDIPQFTRRGGMIQFVVEANKVRFEVNLTMAERAGLILSSQLLKVAISVRRSSQTGV